MSFSIEPYWENWRVSFETILDSFLPPLEPEPLREAMRYATLQGGKRFRPLLAAATAEGLFATHEQTMLAARAGCVLELVHAHSLVHDDLPCLDNDLLRRGQPTTHATFGEALALLTGDALLVWAFRCLARETLAFPDLGHRLLSEYSEATFDMVRGQVADLLSEGKEIDAAALSLIHRNKTGALILAAVRSGAHCAGASPERLFEASAYANAVGLAFQIADDILDETATAGTLGKTPGKDREARKATYVKQYGLTGAQVEAERQTEIAIGAIQNWPNPDPLTAIARFVVTRNH